MDTNRLDFQPSKGLMITMFIVVTLIYGGGPGLIGYFAISDLLKPQEDQPPGLLIGVLVALGLFIGYALFLFYFVFNALRYRFTEEGIDLLTIRGRKLFPWNKIERVDIRMNKNSPTLVLRYADSGPVRIALFDYKKSRSLFDQIQRHLPSPIILPAQVAPWVFDH